MQNPIKTGDLVAPASKKCLCGCGSNVTSKVNYRPGHDARHISRLVEQAEIGGFSDSVTSKMFTQLPSATLQAKFAAALERARVKAHASRERGRAKALRRAESNPVNPKSSTIGVRSKSSKLDFVHVNNQGSEQGQTGAFVKVGRWEYPVDPSDSTLRNLKRDGSGEWTKI